MNDICHKVRDTNTSGLNGHVTISGGPSMSHLFVDTFIKLARVEQFAFPATIAIIQYLCWSVWLHQTVGKKILSNAKSEPAFIAPFQTHHEL